MPANLGEEEYPFETGRGKPVGSRGLPFVGAVLLIVVVLLALLLLILIY